MSTSSEEGAELAHSALLYRDTDDVVEALVPFLDAGIDRRAAVMVAARPEHVAALRAATGARADAATWASTFEWHPHPATRLRAFHGFVTDVLRRGAGSVHLVGEPVWPDGPPEFVLEWERYESTLNAVLAPFAVDFVCLYDVSRLDRDLLDAAWRTHPTVRGDGSASWRFEPPEELLAARNPPFRPPPGNAIRLRAVDDLAAARAFLQTQAVLAGLSAEGGDDLALAANEVITNALVHGRSAPDLAVWMENGRLLCQIDDRGPGFVDPLAGYRPPDDGESGRGLWIARQLVDLLRVVPSASGTSVRLYSHPV